jgi:hypothetical protein
MSWQSIGPSRPPWPRTFSHTYSIRPRRGAFWLGGVVLALALIFAVLRPITATAQIQQAWVAHYNNGITNGTNQAVKMALDSAGNIYVTGFSQNANSNLGYVTIKYAPNGNQLWATRYDSTNYPTATPSGLVLDSNNNVVVTGSAMTVKYDTNGNQLWTAPYSGNGVAMDAAGNCIITGFDSGFNAVKISPTGTNLWVTIYNQPLGPAVSQVVGMDGGGNSYVAGGNTYACYYDGPNIRVCYEDLLIIKYDQNGNQVWTAENIQESDQSVEVPVVALDSGNNLYVVAETSAQMLAIFKYASNGSLAWTAGNPDEQFGPDVVHGLTIDKSGNMLCTGQFAFLGPNDSYGTFAYGTYKANANGSWLWTNVFPIGPFPPSSAQAMALDSANNPYITGYSPGTNSDNDIVTIKYDPNGNQIWLQRYNGPGNSNASGNAIAVDNNGNVYVTGYDTTAAGGTEIVTIKYSPVILQRRSDGTVILQAQGSPGESFDVQASQDLLNWLDLGSVLADTNGLMQFDDTNAPIFPARFYYTSPQ